MARCFASNYVDASVIGVDIREDYLAYARRLANGEGLRNVEFHCGSDFCYDSLT